MFVKVKRLHPDAMLPTYANEGDACFDLSACDPSGSEVRIWKPTVINTGLAFEIPTGYVMLIYSRSGHGFKHDVRLSNCVGVIDSGYRGEVKVKLTTDKPNCQMTVKHGDRIAQAMIIPVTHVKFDEVEELAASERGEGGFGSSGV